MSKPFEIVPNLHTHNQKWCIIWTNFPLKAVFHGTFDALDEEFERAKPDFIRLRQLRTNVVQHAK